MSLVVHRGGNHRNRAVELLGKSPPVSIEADVHLSMDHEVVVQYEPTVVLHGRETYIKDIDIAGLPPENRNQLFLLRDLISYWNQGSSNLVIDIKNGPVFYDGIEGAIGNLLMGADLDRVFVQSFDQQVIHRMKLAYNDIQAGVLMVGVPHHVQFYRDFVGADFLQTTNKHLRRETVEEADRAGMYVTGWATADIEVVNRLRIWGVRLITIEEDILEDLQQA